MPLFVPLVPGRGFTRCPDSFGGVGLGPGAALSSSTIWLLIQGPCDSGYTAALGSRLHRDKAPFFFIVKPTCSTISYRRHSTLGLLPVQFATKILEAQVLYLHI